MNRQMKKYLVLIFVILIPLIATYLIGSYGYNSDKFGQGAWKNEYKEEYLTFNEEDTTRDKIDKYLSYGVNNQYHVYKEDPVFSQTIQTNGKNLFHLEIIQTIYKTQVRDEDDNDFVEVDRISYLFFIYDVQYQNIRDLIPGEETLRQEINEANVPSLTIKLTEVLEDEEREPLTKEVRISEIGIILDEGADFDNIRGEVLADDEESGSRLLAVVLGTVSMDNLEWSNFTEIEIKASVTIPNSEDVSTTLKTLELELDLEVEDTSNYLEAYQQELEKTGYFKWAFKNYLWWICLITLMATGLITFSFYGVYLAEEKEAKQRKRKIRSRR